MALAAMCVCMSFIYISLHRARQAMAAALPLPLAGWPAGFLINLFLPRTTHSEVSQVSIPTKPA